MLDSRSFSLVKMHTSQSDRDWLREFLEGSSFNRKFFPINTNQEQLLITLRCYHLHQIPVPWLNYTLFIQTDAAWRRREAGVKQSMNSDFGHVGMNVCMYVWHLESSREPRHVAQQMCTRQWSLQF